MIPLAAVVDRDRIQAVGWLLALRLQRETEQLGSASFGEGGYVRANYGAACAS